MISKQHNKLIAERPERIDRRVGGFIYQRDVGGGLLWRIGGVIFGGGALDRGGEYMSR